MKEMEGNIIVIIGFVVLLNLKGIFEIVLVFIIIKCCFYFVFFWELIGLMNYFLRERMCFDLIGLIIVIMYS